MTKETDSPSLAILENAYPHIDLPDSGRILNSAYQPLDIQNTSPSLVVLNNAQTPSITVIEENPSPIIKNLEVSSGQQSLNVTVPKLDIISTYDKDRDRNRPVIFNISPSHVEKVREKPQISQKPGVFVELKDRIQHKVDDVAARARQIGREIGLGIEMTLDDALGAIGSIPGVSEAVEMAVEFLNRKNVRRVGIPVVTGLTVAACGTNAATPQVEVETIAPAETPTAVSPENIEFAYVPEIATVIDSFSVSTLQDKELKNEIQNIEPTIEERLGMAEQITRKYPDIFGDGSGMEISSLILMDVDGNPQGSLAFFDKPNDQQPPVVAFGVNSEDQLEPLRRGLTTFTSGKTESDADGDLVLEGTGFELFTFNEGDNGEVESATINSPFGLGDADITPFLGNGAFKDLKAKSLEIDVQSPAVTPTESVPLETETEESIETVSEKKITLDSKDPYIVNSGYTVEELSAMTPTQLKDLAPSMSGVEYVDLGFAPGQLMDLTANPEFQEGSAESKLQEQLIGQGLIPYFDKLNGNKLEVVWDTETNSIKHGMLSIDNFETPGGKNISLSVIRLFEGGNWKSFDSLEEDEVYGKMYKLSIAINNYWFNHREEFMNTFEDLGIHNTTDLQLYLSANNGTENKMTDGYFNGVYSRLDTIFHNSLIQLDKDLDANNGTLKTKLGPNGTVTIDQNSLIIFEETYSNNPQWLNSSDRAFNTNKGAYPVGENNSGVTEINFAHNNDIENMYGDELIFALIGMTPFGHGGVIREDGKYVALQAGFNLAMIEEVFGKDIINNAKSLLNQKGYLAVIPFLSPFPIIKTVNTQSH